MTEKAPFPDGAESDADDLEWAGRSQYWRTYKPVVRGRPKKHRHREPLVLCGHGVKLRIDHGTLLIRNGFTHYPQKQEEFRFFPGDPNLPDRIVMLDGSGGVSFDALAWLSEQQVILIQLDWRGRVQIVGGATGHTAKPDLVDAQRHAQKGPRQIAISKWLIREKIDASISTLKLSLPKCSQREEVLLRLSNSLEEIKAAPENTTLASIFGIEGRAASHYFRAWHGQPLSWTGLKRKPIPESWHTIGPRNMGWRGSTQNARHPVNAMLNYGYGILVSEVRIQAVAGGFDPSIGVMHGSKENRIPLIYDLMEPLRPVVDRAIFQFVKTHKFTPGDFTINQYGGCRINPEMAGAIATTVDISATKVISEFRKLLRA